MATRNMGGTDVLQIKQLAPDGTFYGKDHVPGDFYGFALQIKDLTPDGSFRGRRHAPGNWQGVMVDPTIYKMRGHNPVTGLDECWVSLNPNSGPPSGASLINKTVTAVITNTFPVSQ
jgi:hypothetical protein